LPSQRGCLKHFEYHLALTAGTIAATMDSSRRAHHALGHAIVAARAIAGDCAARIALKEKFCRTTIILSPAVKSSALPGLV
jgi:hypothetical protein